MILETVKIDRPEHRLGYVIINKSDFDPETMSLYGAEKTDKTELTKKQIAEALIALGVEFDGAKKKDELYAILIEAQKPKE